MCGDICGCHAGNGGSFALASPFRLCSCCMSSSTKVADRVLDVHLDYSARAGAAMDRLSLARCACKSRPCWRSGSMPASASISGCAPSPGTRPGATPSPPSGYWCRRWRLPATSRAAIRLCGRWVPQAAPRGSLPAPISPPRPTLRSCASPDAAGRAMPCWCCCPSPRVGSARVIYRLRRPAMLTHANGQTMPILPGATVLETLRAYGIPHASVCGGRARCTTCRIRVVDGLAHLAGPRGPRSQSADPDRGAGRVAPRLPDPPHQQCHGDAAAGRRCRRLRRACARRHWRAASA